MGYHLFVDDNTLGIGNPNYKPWQHLSHWEYFIKRIQFWKYRKHRTMGRPILMRWRQSNE